MIGISSDNLLILKGKIKCEFKDENIEEANKSINKYNSLNYIYNKIESFQQILLKILVF